MDEPTKTGIDWKRLALVASLIFLTTIIISVCTIWALLVDSNEHKVENQMVGSEKLSDKEFQSYKIFDVVVDLPKKWGTLKVVNLAESSNNSVGPITTYRGAVAEGDKLASSAGSPIIINVSDFSSMLKLASNKTLIQKDIDFYNNIYTSRTLYPNDLFNTSLLIQVDSITAIYPYSPRYIESQNGKWRGVWFVSYSGQEMNGQVYAMAALYNKESSRVITFCTFAPNDRSEQFQKEIDDLNTPDYLGYDNDKEAKLQNRILDYIASSYYTNNQVKNFVDNEFLATINRLN